jgi:hypothetical protein
MVMGLLMAGPVWAQAPSETPPPSAPAPTAPAPAAPAPAAPAPAGEVQTVPAEPGTPTAQPTTSPPPPVEPTEGAYEYEQRVRAEQAAEPTNAAIGSSENATYEEPPAVETEVKPEHGGYHGPFAQGRTRISVVLGSATGGFDSTYLILGAGVGFFVLDGFAVEVDAQAWLFGDPFTATVTPGLRYIFWMVPKVNPYIGAFYRHYFIENPFDDFDTYGARAGLLLQIGDNGYLGAGAVYERRFSCDNDEFRSDCDQWYPEITFSLSF